MIKAEMELLDNEELSKIIENARSQFPSPNQCKEGFAQVPHFYGREINELMNQACLASQIIQERAHGA